MTGVETQQTRIEIALPVDEPPGGEGRLVGILGQLGIDRNGYLHIAGASTARTEPILQRLCDRYNAIERLSTRIAAPDGNPLQSWTRIVGRGDADFADALIQAISEDFGMQVSKL